MGKAAYCFKKPLIYIIDKNVVLVKSGNNWMPVSSEALLAAMLIIQYVSQKSNDVAHIIYLM